MNEGKLDTRFSKGKRVRLMFLICLIKGSEETLGRRKRKRGTHIEGSEDSREMEKVTTALEDSRAGFAKDGAYRRL